MQKNPKRCKPGDVITVDYGMLSKQDENYGQPVSCYVCDSPHKALAVARIEDKSTIAYAPLCECCCLVKSDVILRKYFNAPDLEISEGGEATTEQVLALVEKQGATEQ